MASASVSKSDSACNVVPMLSLVKGQPRASSLQVAEHFARRHDNVVKAIRSLEIPDEFRLLNFEESSYKNGQGKEQPLILMTRDGFTILVMGFTGKKAMEWKLRYMDAFNAMERELCKPTQAEQLAPSALTPEQCRQLHDVMDAKMSSIPQDQRRGAYAGAWTRFNRHFRIAKYEQLPPEKFSEALEYLINMQLRQKALPSQETLPAPVDEPDSFKLLRIRDALAVEINGFRERLAPHTDAVLGVYGKRIWAGYTSGDPLNDARRAAYDSLIESVNSMLSMSRAARQAVEVLAHLEQSAERREPVRRP